MQRFIARAANYSIGLAEDKIIFIDNIEGYQTANRQEIELLKKHADFNNLFFAVPTAEQLQIEAKEQAMLVLKQIAAAEPPLPKKTVKPAKKPKVGDNNE